MKLFPSSLCIYIVCQMQVWSKTCINLDNYVIELRGVGVGWAEWAIAHPGFGRSVDPNQRGQIVPPIHYYLPTQLYLASYAPGTKDTQGQNQG